jgi:hypothetical protein
MSMGSGEAVAKTPPDQLIIGMNMNNGIFGLSGLPGRRLDKRSAIGYLFF